MAYPERKGAYGTEHSLSRNRVPLRADRGEVIGAPQAYYDFWKPNADGSYTEDMSRFIDAGTKYPQDDEIAPAENFLRERFGIGSEGKVFLSATGSEGILERIPRLLFKQADKTILYGVSPHFGEIVRFVNQYPHTDKKHIKYVPVQMGIYHTAIDVLGKMLEQAESFKKSRRGKGTNVSGYISNGAVAGQIIPKDQLLYAAGVMDELGGTLIVDEAYASVLPDEESMMGEIGEFKGLIVLGTESKVDGFAGWRFGYAGMSSKLGEDYKDLVNPYDIPGPAQVLMNKMFDNEILGPHRQEKRKMIVARKIRLMSELDKLGIQYLPTDPRTPILMVDSGTDIDLHATLADLGLAATPGRGFGATHNAFKTNRFVRVTIPEESKISDFANRLLGAVKANTNPSESVRQDRDDLPLGYSPRDPRNRLD